MNPSGAIAIRLWAPQRPAAARLCFVDRFRGAVRKLNIHTPAAARSMPLVQWGKSNVAETFTACRRWSAAQPRARAEHMRRIASLPRRLNARLFVPSVTGAQPNPGVRLVGLIWVENAWKAPAREVLGAGAGTQRPAGTALPERVDVNTPRGFSSRSPPPRLRDFHPFPDRRRWRAPSAGAAN
jgi:hypothetical protein